MDIPLGDGFNRVKLQRSSNVVHDPWIYRYFFGNKDAKLRVRERYWHYYYSNDYDSFSPELTSTTTTSSTNGEDGFRTAGARAGRHGGACPIILPDAVTWRKYLPVLEHLVSTMASTTPATMPRHARISGRAVELVLLESVSELLDYRNQSHSENSVSSNERNQLLKLFQFRQHPSVRMEAFPDLSLRDIGQEEWEWMHYDQLNMDERCRHALLRAGHLLLLQPPSQQVPGQPRSGRDGCEANVVWLVVSDVLSLQNYESVTLDEGVEILSLLELIERLIRTLSLEQDQQQRLKELMTLCDNEYVRRNQPLSSRAGDDNAHEILTPEEVQAGLRNGSLLRGRLEVSKDNPKEAYVTVRAGASHQSQTYFVDKQRGHFNHAFHHDVVALRVLPEKEWGRPTRRLVHYRDDAENDSTDTAALSLDGDSVMVPSARVVSNLEPSRRIFVGTVIDAPKDTDSHLLVVPMDVRIPKIRIPARYYPNYIHQRLLIQVDAWDVTSTYPQGRCLQVLGPVGDLETEIQALLHENEVSLDPFSAAALACMPLEGSNWRIPVEETTKRLDLRTSRIIFSVDPPGCQDIDDSMHAHVQPNGDVEVGVHIADVTYFVKHNSALDLESQVRGTTFYLVDRRFDMLPSLLSSDLCSLHGHTDRLAVSVIWTLSPDLKQIKHRYFGRTIIHNCAAMTYDQADNILQGRPPDEPGSSPPPPLTAGGPVDPKLIPSLRSALSVLTTLARNLRKDREELGGAVDLSSGDLGNELKFTLQNGQPVKVVPKADKEIHHTIAELMILANTSVAEAIYETFPDSALLRVHRTVEGDRFGELRELLDAYGIVFEGSRNMSLATTLKQASRKNPIVDALLKSFATRAMSEAQYVCTGDIDQIDQLSHYGLGLSKYTHFTSPIRRYADVVVHKQLLASLQLSEFADSMNLEVKVAPTQQLMSLPESNVVSILQGEGLMSSIDVTTEDEDFLDSLIEGASELALGPQAVSESSHASPAEQHETEDIKPYRSKQVTQICERLNLHNRLAKYSSAECQKLFLSLYFRNCVEVAQGVVIKLRSNGFLCYIPKFDLRLPVYVMDVSNQLQIDPRLLGLPPDFGLPCSKGFARAECRIIPHGKCELLGEPNDERLVISAPSSPFSFTVGQLDIVTIQLACESFDLRARVPPPRAYLLSHVSTKQSLVSQRQEVVMIDSDRLHKLESTPSKKDMQASSTQSNNALASSDKSLFQILAAVRRRKKPGFQSAEDVPRSESQCATATHPKTVTIQGRVVFGTFVNPDTRSARQEAAQKNAAAEAAQRRANAMAGAVRRNEYDTTRRMEREAMSRQQRLAAEKRNARRSKAK